jgi:hypothetical protein
VPDFRIATGKKVPEDHPDGRSVVEVLIHRADDIANRYKMVAANLPYRALAQELLDDDVAALSAQLGAATWKRIGDEVPSYAFAEKVGRGYQEAGASPGSLLLHWQILRRAIHLVLADERLRTGQGKEDQLRHSTLMDYTLDWATEASLVGYVIAGQDRT